MRCRPSKHYTLDRIDNNNAEYSPENCRWADKYTQNSNKGNNVYLTSGGKTLTVSQWAAATDQKADTLYKRVKNGWSDEEVITGIRKSKPTTSSSMPWPTDNSEQWENAYRNILRNQDQTPIDFYILMCEQALSNLYCKLERVNFDPAYDESNQTPQERWDLEAQHLWSNRLDFARRYAHITPTNEKWKQRLSKHGLSIQSTPMINEERKVLLGDLQALTGHILKDRP
jgi:hypothetical protein